jgi:hypothetical protein
MLQFIHSIRPLCLLLSILLLSSTCYSQGKDNVLISFLFRHPEENEEGQNGRKDRAPDLLSTSWLENHVNTD